MAGLMDDYWDLDAALAEGEKVLTQFSTSATWLGFLDPALSSDDDLPARSKVELPIWLAHKLSSNGVVRTSIPSFIQKKAQNLVEAQSRQMDVRTLSPYYYEVAQAVFTTAPSVESKSINQLLSLLCERQKEIFSQAQHAENEDVSGFVSKLTSVESQLYTTCVESAKEMEQFKKAEITRIKADVTSKRRRLV